MARGNGEMMVLKKKKKKKLVWLEHMVWFIKFKCQQMRFKKQEDSSSWRVDKPRVMKTALRSIIAII